MLAFLGFLGPLEGFHKKMQEACRIIFVLISCKTNLMAPSYDQLKLKRYLQKNRAAKLETTEQFV